LSPEAISGRIGRSSNPAGEAVSWRRKATAKKRRQPWRLKRRTMRLSNAKMQLLQ